MRWILETALEAISVASICCIMISLIVAVLGFILFVDQELGTGDIKNWSMFSALLLIMGIATRSLVRYLLRASLDRSKNENFHG